MPDKTAVLAPERFRVLSGSALKVIAVISMLIDHVTKRILIHYPALMRQLFVTPSGKGVSWCVIGESIGRLAFPLYCFLLVEGFVYTRDRRRYGLNLLLFALISEIPFDLCRSLQVFDPSYQNVFFTLFISYLAIWAHQSLVDRPVLRIAAVVGLALASMGLLCDYGARGFATVMVLYALRQDALAKTALGFCVNTATWRAGLAFIPINLYNGERGFVRGPVLKFLFYAFYPAHLLALWYLRIQMGFLG